MTAAPATSEHAGRGEDRGGWPQRMMLVAVVGNPNTGKTTLFNQLCGLRHRTGNFPGTTQEARVGNAGDGLRLIDLPGAYSLELEQSEAEICRRVLAGDLAAPGLAAAAPDAVLVVVDAANLERNLLLVGEVLRRRLPTVVVLNMIDLARGRGQEPNAHLLEELVGCGVVSANARSGEGVKEVAGALAGARIPNVTPPGTQEGLEHWGGIVRQRVVRSGGHGAHAGLSDTMTDKVDRVVTHPATGLVIFAAVMFGLFWTIFRLAEVPMNLIEAIFGSLSAWVQRLLPAGLVSQFVSDGVIAGVGATVVFLPQICLLFFLISLLEDTGYLARAAFLVDRFMRPFGLSGHAFVPLLSSHACALPGIMAARAIPDRKERLAAILVAPFMSCSARIPVYVLLTMVLFPGSATKRALAFSACYAIGVLAGLFSALVARRTILKGKGRPMALELPTYKWPSLRTALLTTWDRALVFLKKAGTNILAICVILWWLSAFPRVAPPGEAVELRQRADAAWSEAAGPQARRLTPEDVAKLGAAQKEGEALRARADELEAAHARAQSFAGKLGRFAQPVFEPLGYDWKLTVGVLTSFAAREVFAGTMAIITTGAEEFEDRGAIERIGASKRDDGVTPVFGAATSWSLLVYFVLAMQCLPTLVVTAREAGGVKWALLQLAWMGGLAYVAAMVVYQVMK